MRFHSILSISDDESLLKTREHILQHEGHSVTSALGFDEGLHRCRNQSFDLVIIGHSLQPTQKAAILAAVKTHGGAPVLQLRRYGQSPLQGADFCLEVREGPRAFIEHVKAVLQRNAGDASGS
jgi:DNA-binding response OmpR family regulator